MLNLPPGLMAPQRLPSQMQQNQPPIAQPLPNGMQGRPETQQSIMPMQGQAMPNQAMAPQMQPAMQAPRPQQPESGASSQGVAGGAPPSLFKSWQKTDDGDYKDLNKFDLGVLFMQAEKQPEIFENIMKSAQFQEQNGGKSFGDFRKDTLAGIGHLLSLFPQEGGM